MLTTRGMNFCLACYLIAEIRIKEVILDTFTLTLQFFVIAFAAFSTNIQYLSTMGVRKCCINDCTSQEDNEKDAGVTFHRFPINPLTTTKWREVCKVDAAIKVTKNTYVCSRHFSSKNFTKAGGRIMLKPGSIPLIFPWNKSNSSAATTSSVPATTSQETPNSENVKEPNEIKSQPSSEPVKKDPTEDDATEKKEQTISKKRSPSKKTISTTKTDMAASTDKPIKTSKRLSAKLADAKESAAKKKTEASQSTSDRKSSKLQEVALPSSVSTPKKKSQEFTFVPGTTIEAQNFDGKWILSKVIEVDMEDREVLVRAYEKKDKTKTGTTDEWIPMDSPRLRPAQPIVTFEVGEKVLARWNDCRKFPATIKRVLENDTYDVLFDDGYPKIVRGIHINKYTSKNYPKTPTAEAPIPTVINPLLLNPPSLIPQYIQEMKDVPQAPTEGEWCCAWVDDIPIGKESSFDGTHGKVPSIIVPDWRVKPGWQKHIYLRQNGKFDVLFVSPTNRKLRFKNELKSYLLEIGETYNPEAWDFSLQKKRSKALGIYVLSDRLKQQQVMPTNVDGTPNTSNSFASLGALPYVQPNLVFPPPAQTEISVGALKVTVVDNIYQCPSNGCDKTFRKENHLQLHIKHYHEDLAKMMGECPNMEDLAYLRTTADEIEEKPLIKTTRKPRVKLDHSDLHKDTVLKQAIKQDVASPHDIKKIIQAQRSPILEEALKAPTLIPVKEESFDALTNHKSVLLPQFDPETLIPPHAVSKTNQARSGPGRKRMRIRFNPKTNKKSLKKRRLEAYQKMMPEIDSSIDGIIPYHEGPYFKYQQSSSYVDENGEVIKIERMKKEEVINCVCGYYEEDGLMIQCELCLCWQHGACNGIEKSQQVPEKYVCYICLNPYRQRPSQKFIHDQDWLHDGKLPIASYHMPNPKQVARFDTLKQCHTLIGNLLEMKHFMHSLNVKINIAEKRGHPKMYLWSKKWEQSPPRVTASSNDDTDDIKSEIKFDDGEILIMMPVVPEPAEAAIEPAKCQQTLLDHIQHQQHSVRTRLDAINAEITALEESSASKCNGKMLVDEPKMKQTIYMLLNDLMKMKTVADLQRNPLPESAAS